MKNKRGFSIISIGTIFVLCLVIVVLTLAAKGVDTSTIQSIIDNLNWSKFGNSTIRSIDLVFQSSDKPEYFHVIGNIFGKAVDFFGYSIMAVGRLAMQLALENPDILNYKVLLVIVILFLISPLIYPAFIILVSLILILKEAIVNKKEKNEKAKRKV